MIDCERIVDVLYERLVELSIELSSGIERPFSSGEIFETSDFTVEIQVMPDQEWEAANPLFSRNMVQVTFRFAGRGRIICDPYSASDRADCDIYLRLGRVGTRIPNAKWWRAGLSGYAPGHALEPGLWPDGSVNKKGWRPLSFMRSRDIYWSLKAPRADLKAQLTVLLFQLQLLPPDAKSAIADLASYLKKEFKLGTNSVDRDVVLNATLGHLLHHWGEPEDYRAWRKYIRIILNKFAREEAQKLELSPGDWRSGMKVSRRPSRNPSESFRAVEVARLLDVSREVIYKWVRKGMLHPLPGVPIRVSVGELDRFKKALGGILRERKARKDEIHTLVERGTAWEAARKAVRRRNGRLPKLAEAGGAS